MNESLLPTRTVLQGNEVLRIVGADGRPVRLPLSSLLDAAEARFATNAREDSELKAAWDAINSTISRVMDLEQAERDANYLAALDALVARLANEVLPAIDGLKTRVGTLEAKPAVSTAGLATQSSVNALASQLSAANAALTQLRLDLTALTTRVTTLEDAARPKTTPPGQNK